MLHIQKVSTNPTTPPVNLVTFYIFLLSWIWVLCFYSLLDLIEMLNSLDIQCQRRNISGIFLLVDGHWSVVSMRLYLALFQKWCKAGSGKWRLSGMSLHRARRWEETWHHECPQWGLLNWSGHLRKEVIGAWGLWPFLHPEWHQRMLRNIIGASSRRSFLCFWVQSDDWWSDGCQYSLWTKLRLIRLNLNLIVKAICSSLRWRSWNKMSKIEFVLVFLNFLKNCEANVIKDPEK